MKQFSITLDFALTKKPSWLDSFRKKYDEPQPYHITLKQDTYLNEHDIDHLKNNVADIAAKYKQTDVNFEKVFINKTVKGQVIMLEMEENSEITDLQAELCDKLSVFGEVILPYMKEFEENFKPHITIARHLSDEKLEEAKPEVGKDTKCSASVDALYLNISEFKGIPFSIIEPDMKIKVPLGE